MTHVGKVTKIVKWVAGLLVALLSYIGLRNLTGQKDNFEERREAEKRSREVEDEMLEDDATDEEVEEIRKRHEERKKDTYKDFEKFVDVFVILLIPILLVTLSFTAFAQNVPDTYDELLKEYKAQRQMLLEYKNKYEEAESDVERLLEIVDEKDKRINRLEELYKMEHEAYMEQLRSSNTGNFSISVGTGYVPFHPSYTSLDFEVAYTF